MLHALEIVRSGMPSARHSVYLNAGTWGPLPTRAADAMRARIDDVETRGRIGYARLRGVPGASAMPRARRSPRPSSSDPERIALTHSTSGGMNLVLGGMTFAAGDEIITTDNEHPGCSSRSRRSSAATASTCAWPRRCTAPIRSTPSRR